MTQVSNCESLWIGPGVAAYHHESVKPKVSVVQIWVIDGLVEKEKLKKFGEKCKWTISEYLYLSLT